MVKERKLQFIPDEIKTTVKLIQLINKFRPSLELPIIYAICGKISSFVNGYGRGIGFIGDKAIGKGEIIKSTFELLPNAINLKLDKFTASFFVKYVKELKLENRNFDLILEDLSTTVDTQYLLMAFYDITSKLIWDKYAGLGTSDVYASDTGLKITDSNSMVISVKSFCSFVGMTNVILGKIKETNKAYWSMYKDRYTEFFPIITKLEKERIDNEFNFNPDGINKISATDLQILINKVINLKEKKIGNNLPLSKSINKEDYRNIYKYLYRNQHTDNRGTAYFNGDLSSHALLNDRDEITNSDLAFMYLFKPNLHLCKFNSATIQRIVQNVLYCEDIYDVQETLGYHNDRYIRNIINRFPSANEVLEIEGDTIALNPEFANLIIEQQDFIKKCLGLKYDK